MSTKRSEDTFDFGDLDVVIRCRGCHRQHKLTGLELRFKFAGGMPYPLSEVKRRLRCREYGHWGVDVVRVPKMD